MPDIKILVLILVFFAVTSSARLPKMNIFDCYPLSTYEGFLAETHRRLERMNAAERMSPLARGLTEKAHSLQKYLSGRKNDF